jgi:hypothetical protein
MSNLRPKVFIGSSTGGYNIAEKVKAHLSTDADCYLWKDTGVWQPNLSTFDNLMRIVRYFDFGIFVATADDLTMTSNGDIVIEPRDNVILEMALYLGALGKEKSFLLVEKGIKLPSDFAGIYMPRFDPASDVEIAGACAEVAAKIKEHYELSYLSFYPTTALAIGYYKNFVEGMVESLRRAQSVVFNNNTFTDFKLNIVIPSDLAGNIREKASLFYERHGFVENTLKTQYRNHPAWFFFDPSKVPHGIIYDMPSTLTGIDDAIELVLQKNYKGRPPMQLLIEERELNNFRKVLQMQIDSSPFAKKFVEIIDEF